MDFCLFWDLSNSEKQANRRSIKDPVIFLFVECYNWFFDVDHFWDCSDTSLSFNRGCRLRNLIIGWPLIETKISAQ